MFILAIAPKLPRLLVHQFRQRFRQAVGKGFRHDGIVVVVVSLEVLQQRFDAGAGLVTAKAPR